MSISLLNNDIKSRFNILFDLGFKLCIWTDENNKQWPVYSIGSPEQGYKPTEIADMSERSFQKIIEQYTN
jgi:hypothetical protein